MYDPDNEFSLNPFTDYRTDTPADPLYKIEGASTDPTIMDAAGWIADFNTKTFTISKPIEFIDLYRGVVDMMTSDIDLIVYQTPILAITKNIFELTDGWTFTNDVSRKNIRGAGWSEGDEQWICIQPLGCNGEITNLSYMWKYEHRGNFSKFNHISTLTREDSGILSEPIKVEGTPKQLSINIDGLNEWRDMESLCGFTNFHQAVGVVAIPVCWYPPAPEIEPEPYNVSFTVSGISPLDTITVMPYNDS